MLSSCDALMRSVLSMQYRLQKGYLSLAKPSLMDQELIYVFRSRRARCSEFILMTIQLTVKVIAHSSRAHVSGALGQFSAAPRKNCQTTVLTGIKHEGNIVNKSRGVGRFLVLVCLPGLLHKMTFCFLRWTNVTTLFI